MLFFVFNCTYRCYVVFNIYKVYTNNNNDVRWFYNNNLVSLNHPSNVYIYMHCAAAIVQYRVQLLPHTQNSNQPRAILYKSILWRPQSRAKYMYIYINIISKQFCAARAQCFCWCNADAFHARGHWGVCICVYVCYMLLANCDSFVTAKRRDSRFLCGSYPIIPNVRAHTQSPSVRGNP